MFSSIWLYSFLPFHPSLSLPSETLHLTASHFLDPVSSRSHFVLIFYQSQLVNVIFCPHSWHYWWEYGCTVVCGLKWWDSIQCVETIWCVICEVLARVIQFINFAPLCHTFLLDTQRKISHGVLKAARVFAITHLDSLERLLMCQIIKPFWVGHPCCKNEKCFTQNIFCGCVLWWDLIC